MNKAKVLAALEGLKTYLKYGTDKQPKWLDKFCIGMRNDGSYDISICIPSHDTVNQSVKDLVPVEIDGVYIFWRIVTKSTYVPLVK